MPDTVSEPQLWKYVHLAKDRTGKAYFWDGRTRVGVEAAHKLWPQLVGQRTADAMQMLKKFGAVKVRLDK